MKIAFLTSEFPHPKMKSSGGIGTSILNLSKGMTQTGNEVVILVYGQDKDDYFVENGIGFYLVKNPKFKGLSRILTQKKIQKLLNTLVDEDKVDIVEVPDWTGISSFIKPKCPLVVKLHGSDTYFCHLDQRPVKFINRFHEKRALQQADAILSVSRYTADLTNSLFGLHREVTVIPNGIDLEKFSSPDVITQENTLLYFGTLIRKKGSLELPLIFNEVYKQNPKARLFLVGRDSNDVISGNASVWDMMQPLFHPAALQNVDYVGSVAYDEIKNYIAAATVCVFPTFAEALPVSWIEAMAMQKAIVASNIGWATEIIDDKVDGFLEHPTNHKAYADKIVTLFANPELRKQFGRKAGEKVAEKFTIETVAQQSLTFYQQVITTSKH
ncbi:glycosyltransferase family 4 protein [Flavobacterium sp. XGLA_31]|uniref:glycosyltransferase family 4 protein n=1 Tax=Flavobacterium sp. XGLA_31 TaxID=3447666 RepID=UPI003F33B8AD